jgi:hypothetical protein
MRGFAVFAGLINYFRAIDVRKKQNPNTTFHVITMKNQKNNAVTI